MVVCMPARVGPQLAGVTFVVDFVSPVDDLKLFLRTGEWKDCILLCVESAEWARCQQGSQGKVSRGFCVNPIKVALQGK